MTDDRPVCIDLFCGYGGWAKGFADAGYRVVGFDIEERCAGRYIAAGGEFVRMDVRNLTGAMLRPLRPTVIVASPPCNLFTTIATKTRDPEKGMGLVRDAQRVIAEALPTFWAIENVRGAYRAISADLGRPLNAPLGRNGSLYLWGHIPPTILPRVRKGWTRDPDAPPSCWTGTEEAPYSDSRENSRIPYPLARALADACLPDGKRLPPAATGPDASRGNRDDSEGA